MAIILCAVFMALSFFFMTIFNGFLSAIFLVLSLIAFMNHTGGGKGPDDKRYA